MSWCRFSTICDNNKSSDLYIYEDAGGGVTVHIASRKRINEELAPKLPEILSVGAEEWLEDCDKRGAWMEGNAPYVHIDLPYAGETYNFDDKKELIKKLDELKELGYNFPEHVFEIAKDWEPDDE